MSLQSFLLFIVYLAILITVARLVGMARWCVMPRPLDPLTMSPVKLKAILEWRGIRSGIAAEKSDLTHLVTQSGSINKVEESVLQQLEDNPGSVVFTSLRQYYRVVENVNTNKGAWLVLVKAAANSRRAESDAAPRSPKYWTSFRRSLGRLGVQIGVLDCNIDPEWCEMKHWKTTCLVLAFPVAHDENLKIAIHEYKGKFLEGDIKDWIRRKLNFRLVYIKHFVLFKAWLKFEDSRRDSDVRVVFATHQDSIPIQLFALRLQALPRVEFGIMRDTQGLFMKWIKDNNFGAEVSLPLLLFLTREGMYLYGQEAEECFEKSCFETFLMFSYPTSAQIFNATVALALVLALFDALLVESGSFDLRLVMENFTAVIGIWIMSWYKLSVIHRVTTCSFASVFRRDFMFYSHHPLLFVVVSLLAFVWLRTIAKDCGFRTRHERRRRDSSHVITRPENVHIRPQPGESEERIQAQLEHARFQEGFLPNRRHFPPGHMVSLPTWMYMYNPDEEDEGAGSGESYIGCSHCVICQSDVERGETLCGLSCKHAFHDTCIKQWLSSGNHFCPICRRKTF